MATATYVRLLPAMCRVGFNLEDAMYAVSQGDYAAAQRYLGRIYDRVPPSVISCTSTNLLKALVCLRMGSPAVAVDLARAGVAEVSALRRVHNGAERAYLQFAGSQIFEDATEQLGAPRTLETGIAYEELDIAKVRPLLREAFPIRRPTHESTMH